MNATASQDAFDSTTARLMVGCGEVFVTIGPVDKPKKILIRTGKQGECRNTLMRVIAGLIRLCIKKGASWAEIQEDIRANHCNQGSGLYPSCSDAIAGVLPGK